MLINCLLILRVFGAAFINMGPILTRAGSSTMRTFNFTLSIGSDYLGETTHFIESALVTDSRDTVQNWNQGFPLVFYSNLRPSIKISIDGAPYFSRIAMCRDGAPYERTEVHRGPQNTKFALVYTCSYNYVDPVPLDSVSSDDEILDSLSDDSNELSIPLSF